MAVSQMTSYLLGRYQYSLFGQDGAGLEQIAVEGRVPIGDVRRSRGTLQIQTAHQEIEHRCYGSQLHAIKYGWHLGGNGVDIAWLHECTHG